MKHLALGIAAASLAAASMSATAWWGPGYDRYYGGYAPYYAYAPYGYAANLTEEQIEAQKQAVESQQKAALEHFQRMEEQRKAMQAAVTEEQIKQIQAQREAMQKAMEERREAMPGPLVDAPFAMHDPMMYDPMMYDPMMQDPMMQDPMGDAIFKQMQAEREAMQKAMEERRKTVPGPLLDAPFAMHDPMMHDPMMHDPMGDAIFKQMQAEREAMQKAMEERRKAMPGPLVDTPLVTPAPVNEEYFKRMEEQRLAMQESLEAQRKAMQKFHEERMKNVRPTWAAPYGPVR